MLSGVKVPLAMYLQGSYCNIGGKMPLNSYHQKDKLETPSLLSTLSTLEFISEREKSLEA